MNNRAARRLLSVPGLSVWLVWLGVLLSGLTVWAIEGWLDQLDVAWTHVSALVLCAVYALGILRMLLYFADRRS